jgi:uncharacterized protein YodC (DUF2158 family)
MDHDFKIGDVVQLKSGGPKMTIEGIGKPALGGSKEQARCVWFEGTKRQHGAFELSSLSKSTV